MLSENDERCEKFYVDTFRRNESGRYVVHQPFKLDSNDTLTNNKAAASAVMISNERQFANNMVLKNEYSRFMDEYLILGHMSLTTTRSGRFLPYHAIWKIDPKP